MDWVVTFDLRMSGGNLTTRQKVFFSTLNAAKAWVEDMKRLGNDNVSRVKINPVVSSRAR